MFSLFYTIKDQFKTKPDAICIDNWVFKLHYRVTCIIFLIATLLVTGREFIGDHIKCISDMKDPGFERVIETFCFFTSTFSVIDNTQPSFQYGDVNHRGVLPYGIDSKQPVRRHYYYQWVPFFLFGQAIMFYLTHILWKKLENYSIYKLVAGLHQCRYAFLEKEIEVDSRTIPTKAKREEYIMRIKEGFLKQVKIHKSWTRWFIFCEVLNVAHVVFQIYITDKFLGNQFVTLGTSTITNGSQTLNDVFPKMTKCTFHKYGPSGSIQVHDALCVMALNIINEKIYLFLYFWFIVLFVVSCLILVWRFLCFVLYSRCMVFNQFIFGQTVRGKLYSWHIKTVVQHCGYSDWLFLKYLSKNVDGLTFKAIFMNITEDLEERKPLF